MSRLNISAREFCRIARRRRAGTRLVLPVFRELAVDTETPVSLYLKLAREERYSYLLESAETSLRWGRYSFISYDPAIIVRSGDDGVQVTGPAAPTMPAGSGLIPTLKRLVNSLEVPPGLCGGLPRFFGGLVGYLGYELVHELEPAVPRPSRTDFPGLPDGFLVFNRMVIVFDHYLNRIRIVALAMPGEDPDGEYRRAVASIEAAVRRIESTVSVARHLPVPRHIPVSGLLRGYRASCTRTEYKDMVRRAVEYVRRGDVVQVLPSRRLSRRTDAEPFDIYRALRMVNPSPYMFFLRLDETTLVGSSPEVLVRKTGRTIEVRPIAGTRPRGDDERADRCYEQELRASEKENAEHLMLVDLARNDIGRVAAFGSVHCPELKTVERYSHVMHLTSLVRGTLLPGLDAMDVLASCFPAGTVSGAPKVRAMQIISELERTTRGPYAGAVGYFGLTGAMDMAITIRTLVCRGGMVHVQSGGGVVADSVPELEYRETLNKAKAPLLAVWIAEHPEER
jgi:anthranilate synthase component 1